MATAGLMTSFNGFRNEHPPDHFQTVRGKVEKTGQRMMSMTLMYRVMGIPKPASSERRLWMNGLTTRWGPGVGGVDGSDAIDLTAAEIKARRALKEHLKNLREQFPDATLVSTATTIGVRETRRITGLYTITAEDALTGRPQPDSVAVSSNPVPGYSDGWRAMAQSCESHLRKETDYSRMNAMRDLSNTHKLKYP